MEITDEFLSDLEAKAKAAKSKPWSEEVSLGVWVSERAVQPAHVLAMIAELREAWTYRDAVMLGDA